MVVYMSLARTLTGATGGEGTDLKGLPLYLLNNHLLSFCQPSQAVLSLVIQVKPTTMSYIPISTVHSLASRIASLPDSPATMNGLMAGPYSLAVLKTNISVEK